MSQTPTNGPTLADVSEVVRDMGTADRDAAAGFGSIVDWELVKFLKRAGWSLLRLSFTWKDNEVLMVIKIRVDEAQYVVFVTRESPTHCMRTFLRKLRENAVALYPDRFA